MQFNRFAQYAWGVLIYNIGVILWGAYVRATISGAGCGQHWPLCNGEVIPFNASAKTLVEYSHRVSSGFALLAVLILSVWAFRAYAKGHVVRTGAVWSTIFIITEALLGAGLVLFELVAHNASLTRTVSISLHLINTFMLLASLTLTAWWASGGAPVRWQQGHAFNLWLLGGIIGMMLIGASGAIVALGDTLFPARSLAEGLAQELDPLSSFLVRLRVVHPLIAIGVGVGLMMLASYCTRQTNALAVHRFAWWLKALILIQWAAGFINVLLLAPVWMQLLHLLIADVMWVVMVLLVATFMAAQETAEATRGALLPNTSHAG